MARRPDPISRGLTAGSVAVTTSQCTYRRWLRWFLVVFMSAVAGAAALHFGMQRVSDAGMTTLGAQNQALQAELDSTRADLERALLDLEIASVTRSEIERQLIVLTEQHKQVREELEFVKSASVRTRGN